MRDLSVLLTARYGDVLPDDDAGRDDATIVAHHLAQYADGNPAKRIAQWMRLRAPWMTLQELEVITVEAITKPKRWRADKLAWRMRLTEADRAALRITTIGAIDANAAQRLAKRRASAKARMAKRRIEQGRRPRAQYEAAALSRAQPWKALNMSRAAWYRAGKPQP